MEIEYPSEFISDIVEEIKKKEDISKIDNDELMKRAEIIREERIKERKASIPTEKETKKTKETNFEKAVKELPDDSWSDFDITQELMKKRDLRRVFKEIARNQPVMASKIRELLDWGDKQKSQSYELIKLLKEMKLIEEIEILEVWAKDYCNKNHGCQIPLLEKEREALIQFSDTYKNIKKKSRNKFVGVSGYWMLTEKGKVFVLMLVGEQPMTTF